MEVVADQFGGSSVPGACCEYSLRRDAEKVKRSELTMSEKHDPDRMDSGRPSEGTPLLQTVPVAEHRERYPHHNVSTRHSAQYLCTLANSA